MVFIRLLFFGFILFVAWIIYLANTAPNLEIFTFVRYVPYGDKAGHVILSGILTLLANLALNCKLIGIGRFQVLLGTVLISIAVIIEEYSQLYIPSRTFSFADLFSDFIGISLCSAIALLVCRAKRKRNA